jgi:hypothetical protein
MGNKYILWASYNSDNNEHRVGVNTYNAIAFSVLDTLIGLGGAGRELVIGGKWNVQRSTGDQYFHGKIRSFWAGRVPWGGSIYDSVRTEFLSLVDSLYSDIALV